LEQLKDAQQKARAPRAVIGDDNADYLAAMKIWWAELSVDERERVFDFARKLRDEAREARKKIAG
jgi:hypothetical protein